MLPLLPSLIATVRVPQAPVQVPSWESLQRSFAYDATKPLDAKELRVGDRVKLTFTNLRGETVHGILAHPDGPGPFPCVALLHGLGGNKEQLFNSMAPELIKQGFAVFALDAALHGERKEDGKSPQAAFLKVVPDTVKDWRQALDWLTKRPEINKDRIGLLGYSMGAFQGSILMGVEPRFQAATLCVGGDPFVKFPGAALAAPSNFIGHATPRPVYFANGTKDTTVTPAASRTLIDAAKAPKVIHWIESGHILPADDVRKGLAWLTLRLKLPAATERYAAPEAAALAFSPMEDTEARVEKVSFTNDAKESVSGLYVRPKDGAGPFPLVLVLHGKGHSKERMLNTMKREFAQRGVAALALDAAGHGERKPITDTQSIFTTTIQDYRQLLPNLLERLELNSEKVGLIGFSMGAMMGTILTAIDERIRVALPCVGGELESLPEACRPAAFAPYLADRPLAFINGHNDPTVPEAAAQKLHAAAGTSPTIFWYAEADHTIPKPTLRLGTDWLIEKLK